MHFYFQYILNVTADLPNVFEDCGSMKYMQIPIADHWSQNLAKFFPRAIKFIGAKFIIHLLYIYSCQASGLRPNDNPECKHLVWKLEHFCFFFMRNLYDGFGKLFFMTTG